MSLDQIIQQWLALGIAPIPIGYKSKKSEINWKQYQKELPGVTDLGLWFGHGEHNLGLVTGHQGLTVIDFDDDEIYTEWSDWARHKRGMACHLLTQGYAVKTSRGRHLYVILPQATRSRRLKRDGDPVGIDVKSRGGYVLAPPSVHPSGTKYEHLGGAIFYVQALSDVLPQTLLLDAEFQPPRLREEVTMAQQVDDPWEAALLPTPALREGTVERIKARYRVEDFFPERESTGDGWCLALCPFHDDQNPSLSINTERQFVSCLAGCTTKPLDVINLYARLHDLSNVEAIHVLAKGL